MDPKKKTNISQPQASVALDLTLLLLATELGVSLNQVQMSVNAVEEHSMFSVVAQTADDSRGANEGHENIQRVWIS